MPPRCDIPDGFDSEHHHSDNLYVVLGLRTGAPRCDDLDGCDVEQDRSVLQQDRSGRITQIRTHVVELKITNQPRYLSLERTLFLCHLRG